MIGDICVNYVVTVGLSNICKCRFQWNIQWKIDFWCLQIFYIHNIAKIDALVFFILANWRSTRGTAEMYNKLFFLDSI